MTTANRCRLRRREDNERGAALVLTVMIAVVLAGLGVATLTRASKESGLSAFEAERAAAFEAAQAGVDDYVAKMTEDHQYYAHFVHAGESTRLRTNGLLVPAAATPTNLTWPGDPSWTYPSGRDRWKNLSNGYEFNLQILPPSGTNIATTIVSSGRRSGSSRSLRTIEVQIRGSSIADFQMVANADISYGNVTTKGRIYAGTDAGGTKHSVTHNGTAWGDVIAENHVSGATTFIGPAKAYDASTTPSVRSVVSSPIPFNTFTGSVSQIQRAAQGSAADNIYLNDATQDGWALLFKSDGSIDIYKCKKNAAASTHLASGTTAQRPACTFTSNKTIPAIGAIYAQQSVMISGVVKGRVTIATNGDGIFGDPVSATSGATYGDLSYDSATPGQNVLGLIAVNEILMPTWSPASLDIVGAVIAQTGQYRSYSSSQSKTSFTHVGAVATNLGGYMTMFTSRSYLYDTNLQFLQPPFYPVLEEAYSILRFREITPP